MPWWYFNNSVPWYKCSESLLMLPVTSYTFFKVGNSSNSVDFSFSVLVDVLNTASIAQTRQGFAQYGSWFQNVMKQSTS